MFKSPASEFVYVRTYSRWLEELGRRENWPETVKRYTDFVHKHLGDKIPAKVMRKIEEKILAFEVMPSMRFLWAAGAPAENDNVTIYNCAFSAIDKTDAFSEALYILMCGTGYGFSVESKYTGLLPVVPAQISPNGQIHEVEDSKAGWADSLKVLINSLYSGQDVEMRYNKVRPAGARLKTMGGRASGPGPLAQLHSFTKDTFYGARGRQLTSLECHDILCEIAQIVVVGGVRRSSEMSISDLLNMMMRNAKSGNFPVRRYMANNSAVYYSKPDMITFMKEWTSLAASGSGERGIFNLEAAKAMAPKRRNAELIRGLNPCKPLKSLIFSDKGYITFEQALERDSLKVVTPDGKIVSATKPFLTKEKAVVGKITLSDGTYLFGTHDHRHMDSDGNWVELKDLRKGTSLRRPLIPIHATQIDNEEQYNLGIFSGWTWGDGSLSRRSDSPGWNFSVCFGVNEMDMAPKFDEMFGIKAKPHHQKPETCLVFSSHNSKYPNILFSLGYNPDKSDLTWLYKQPKDVKLGFIRAAFTTDGSVRKQNNVELYSIHRSSLEVLVNILREFGISSTLCVHNHARSYVGKDGKQRNNKTTYKINVYSGQFKKIGFLSKFKSNLLDTHALKENFRNKESVSVVDIDLENSIEDVYDITVNDPSHSFIDSGVVTHNCGEIMLRSDSFCNLSEVIARADDDMDTMLEKIETATWMGVIQSCFTKFPYLNPNWSKNCEEERLLGVSITGQFDAPHLLHKEALKSYKAKAIKVAKKASTIMGIPMPAAITCVKPSGSVSQLVDSSSGLHPRFSKYYIRRYRISNSDPLFRMIRDQGVPVSPENGQRKQDYVKAIKLYDANENKVEGMKQAKSVCPIFDLEGWNADKVNTWVASFPVASPKNAVTVEDVSALDQLEHYKKIQKNWCEHNASITVYVKNEDWLSVGDWVYKNWEIVNGVSFLPLDDSVYEQAPYEKITKEEFDKLSKTFPKIDYTQLGKYETEDNTEGAKSLACQGGSCDV